MIRLVACDVDGTLLPYGTHQIEERVFDEIRRLIDKDIIFCLASGRQYASLQKLFAPVIHLLPCLCENGAIIYGPGEPGPVLAKTEMDREKAIKLCYQIMDIPECEVLISGANTSYLCPKTSSIISYMQDYGNNVQIIKHPEDVPEEIIKVAAFRLEGATALVTRFDKVWKDFHPAPAGYEWLDFSVADKSKGLKQLLDILDISLDEVIAIGDNYNDLSMLQSVKYPYIMKNAAGALKRCISQHCDDVPTLLKTL